MFQKPTVFIVGAGCSAEFGLPVGDGLRDMIVKRLPDRSDRDSTEAKYHISSALKEIGGNGWMPWLAACEQIKRGLHHASSIDRFLDFHQENEALVQAGKIGIAETILAAEASSSSLRITNGHLNPARLKNNWLSELFILMQEGARKSKLEDIFTNVSFVCFNYDRCIEHYFFHAIKAFALTSDSDAATATKHLQIVHPYGRVGGLPWNAVPEEPVLEFGTEGVQGPTISRVAKGIRTFAERVEEGEELDKIRTMVREAHQIVFLGFSYLDQNMDLLRPTEACNATSVFGTTFRESESNANLAIESIRKLLVGSEYFPNKLPPSGYVTDPTMVDVAAADFLKAYGNRLRR